MSETQKHQTSEKTANPAVRKKISVKTCKLSDMDVGFTFKGKFIQWTKGQPFSTVNEKTGEILTKELQFALFEDLATGERISYVADKGLIDQMNLAGVNPGDKIEVQKLGKTKIGKGREMNQYDIFALNPN